MVTAFNVVLRTTGVNSSLALKAPVRCATTGPITLSGLQTIDGITFQLSDVAFPNTGVNTRVLVKNQTDQTTNGIWVVNSAAWTRAADFDSNDDFINSTRIYVASGSQQGEWLLNSADPITLGVSAITFIPRSLVISAIGSTNSVASVSALMGTPGSINQVTVTRWYAAEGDGGGGIFVWSTLNHAADVTNDPQHGIYVPPSSDPTGASGAWVRQFLDKYYLNWFGVPTSGDCSAAFQAAINTIPDGSKIGVVGTPHYLLANSILLSQRTALIIEGGPQSDGTAGSVPIIEWTGSAGGTMFNFQNSGLCFLKGFDLRLNNANIGVDLYNTGVGRINTNCGVFDCYIENNQANASFIGIRAGGNAADNGSNNEFHEFRRNRIGGSSSGRTGSGIQFGFSSNAHAHILDSNTFDTLNKGIDANWLGIRMEGRNNFVSCNINVTWQHISFPCDLGFMNSENAKQAIVAGANESPVHVHHCRFAGLGSVVTATGLFQFPTFGTSGPMIFERNLIGNGAELVSGAFIYDFKGSNTFLYLKENNYNMQYVGGTDLTTAQVLNNWNAYSQTNYLSVENDGAIRLKSGGQLLFPYIKGRWMAPDQAGVNEGPQASNLGILGVSTEVSGTSHLSSGTLTVNYGVTHLDDAGTPALTAISIPSQFNWLAGQFTVIAKQPFTINGSGNIIMPAGVSVISPSSGQVVDFRWDGTSAYPVTSLKSS